MTAATTTRKASTKKAVTGKNVNLKAFVAPPKPVVDPDSLKQGEYGYSDAKGEFRYWQGWDAKYKRYLMKVSRSAPQTADSRKAEGILLAKGWSTEGNEEKQRGKVARRASKA